MYDQAKTFLMNQLDSRATDTGKRVLSTVESLKVIAEELRSDELSRPTAQLADRGAETLERVGRYLEQSNSDRLLADAERFGRERPWVIAVAGMALGLAGSRMLKASAARRYRFEGEGYEENDYTASYPSTSGSSASARPYPVASDAAPSSAASQTAPSAKGGFGTSGVADLSAPTSSGPTPYDVASESVRRKAAERPGSADGT